MSMRRAMDNETAKKIDSMSTKHFYDSWYCDEFAEDIKDLNIKTLDDSLENFPEDIQDQVRVYKRDFCGKSRNKNIRKFTVTPEAIIKSLLYQELYLPDGTFCTEYIQLTKADKTKLKRILEKNVSVNGYYKA